MVTKLGQFKKLKCREGSNLCKLSQVAETCMGSRYTISCIHLLFIPRLLDKFPNCVVSKPVHKIQYFEMV